MMRRIAKSRLDDAREFLLFNVVETYFEMSDSDAERYRELLTAEGEREVLEMEVTWADKMVEKGRQEGQRKTLLRQMEKKFGPLPKEIQERVAAIDSPAELDTYLERILTADSLEEMGLA